MTWQEWLGSLLMLLGIGGIVILLAEALCCLLGLDRKRPKPEEFEEPAADSDYMQNRVRQLRAMAKHRAATTGPLADADVDAYFAQVDAEITAEAAAIAKRCEVRK